MEMLTTKSTKSMSHLTLLKINTSHLEMRAIEAPSNLPEQWNHTPLEFSGLGSLQHFFQFSKEENLLLAVGQGPVLQQTPYNCICQLIIFLHKLRYESPNKKQLMLLLHWQSKPINYTKEKL
ncbi:hypothetical protein EUGRSUZ_L03724 [Eucalyptus grandis]|uniref:Uncharacterized protein n=1 Tax=Eucalyptus grandis TaxID=71139 RepID=A0AAD9T7T3_EUCGR|nr:hypothetical protein EUGRSUZ_L03724 [Eucalyptus grandis]